MEANKKKQRRIAKTTESGEMQHKHTLHTYPQETRIYAQDKHEN